LDLSNRWNGIRGHIHQDKVSHPHDLHGPLPLLPEQKWMSDVGPTPCPARGVRVPW
jgi:hypothetical protein